MRLPFASLRQNLIAAFAAVIVLSLLLASGAFVILLRTYQADRERDRLELLALSTSALVVRGVRTGVPVAEIESQLDQVASAAGARILLLNERGVVVHDTEQGRLADRPLPVPRTAGRQPGVFQGTIDTPSGEQFYAVVPFRAAGYRVAVLAPEQTLTTAWRALLPRLAFAALAALLVSAAIAWWLASSITRPLVRLTRASAEMARGQFDQEFDAPARPDEVRRLTTAFKTMAQEVARSHRAMRDLLTNVGHDLRTPLTSIQGFASALVDGTIADREGSREAGRVIGEEAERMRHLVDDLLYLGRIEAGEVVLERSPVELGELVRAGERRFARRAEEGHVSLVAAAPPGVTVLGDAHRLARVLDNLLDNALKHAPPGGLVELSLAIERPPPAPRGRAGSSAGARAVLRVHNTGSFIPPQEAERVFERFYQVEKARSTTDGRGLGLAIAREIVQAHEGTIAVESSPDAGTTFVVALPLLEGAEATRLSSAEAGGAARTAGSAPART